MNVKTVSAVPAPAPAAASVVERARRGDQQAFAALVRQYDRGLRALAYRLLGDRDRMEDALQEAYVSAFRALPRFRGDSDLGTWLYRIAYNACLDELERSRKLVHLPLAEIADTAGNDELVERLATRRALARALAALPLEDRAAVLLVDAEGYSYADAARILAVPEGTVASRLNRARASLRRALGDRPEGAA
jgi:RNA polymerase sigma-70 factor, ECF subfamily